MRNIHVFGSVNMDLVTRVERLPQPGETVAGLDLAYSPGGKGANQAVAAARLGGRVHFVGRVGDDAFGKLLMANLADSGVGVGDLVVEPAVSSGTAVITVDGRGQNCIVVTPGANGRVDFRDVDRLVAKIEPGDVVLLQLEVPLLVVEDAAARANARGGRVILDPAPVPLMPLSEGLLRDAEFVTPNQTETAALLRHPVEQPDDARSAATELRRLGVRVPVVKLGGDGVVYLDAGAAEPRHEPSLPARVVDTVAAGDAFNGAFSAALADGQSTADAIRWGLAAGSLCVERRGAQAAMPTRVELLGRLNF